MEVVECRLTILNENSVQYNDDRETESTRADIWGKSWEETLNRELSEITIKRLNHWVASYESAFQREDLQILGQHLYEILFRNKKIRKTFETTYRWFDNQFQKRKRDRGSDPEMRFRIRLDFKKPAQQLASYPWEFLYMPRDKQNEVETAGFFLAGQKTELILTRFVPGQKGLDLKPEEPPLRILIAFSHPQELDTVGVEDVTDAIKSLKQADKSITQVEVLENPTHATLQAKIKDKQFAPHVVHFIGHGKAGQIALMKDPTMIDYDPIRRAKGEEAHWIDSASVCSLFTEHKPRLVFLHACNGAAADSLDSFKNTARELISSGIPAVVAMQYGISNEDASTFAKVFYQQISQGQDIDEAVKAGRLALGNQAPAWDNRRFGTPLVYLQSEKPIVHFRPVESTPAPVKVPCPYPDNCAGMVMPNWARCIVCRRPLMQCPNCKGAMAKDKGICNHCEYEAPSAPATAPAPPSAAATAHSSERLVGDLAG